MGFAEIKASMLRGALAGLGFLGDAKCPVVAFVRWQVQGVMEVLSDNGMSFSRLSRHTTSRVGGLGFRA